MTTSIAETIKGELADFEVAKDVRSRVEQWIVADREFNVWFLETTKRALADDELMGLLDGYRESQDIVEDAWHAFRKGRDENGATLIARLAESIGRMAALQSKT